MVEADVDEDPTAVLLVARRGFSALLVPRIMVEADVDEDRHSRCSASAEAEFMDAVCRRTFYFGQTVQQDIRIIFRATNNEGVDHHNDSIYIVLSKLDITEVNTFADSMTFLLRIKLWLSRLSTRGPTLFLLMGIFIEGIFRHHCSNVWFHPKQIMFFGKFTKTFVAII